MTSHSKLDPDFLPLLDMFPPFELSTEAIPLVREQLAAMAPPIDSEDTTVTMEERFVPSHNESHQIRVLIYRYNEAESNCPALIEIHGGGYIVGTADQGDANNRQLATIIKGVVIAVDYRLAPETPFPGAIEDNYSALKWLYSNAASLGVDKKRLGVIGTSAGGGLSAGLCLLARDRGEIPLAFQGLLMPMLDNMSVKKYEQHPNPNLGEYIWTMENNRFCWQAMLNTDPCSEDVSCYAAPARATSLENLPHTYISIGAIDLFVEETLSYAQRLVAAGVPVDCHIYSGAPHAYSAVPDATASLNEQRLLTDALGKAFQLDNK